MNASDTIVILKSAATLALIVMVCHVVKSIFTDDYKH